MEEDRYKTNHFLYIVGMLSMFLSLGLLAFCFFLMPHLLFGWEYDVPQAVIGLQVWLQNNYGYDDSTAEKWVMFIAFVPAFFSVFVAVFSSNRIDRDLLDKNDIAQPGMKHNIKDSTALFLNIVFLIATVFAIAALIEWLISISS